MGYTPDIQNKISNTTENIINQQIFVNAGETLTVVANDNNTGVAIAIN